ncbi:MAG: PAS domain S-box protein, partial [Ignavibacteria bacterium]|nr:PAS domain S-box protein [Ignavibacteria bacterium]
MNQMEMKLTKRQKYFIGLITLILFAFTAYKVTFWRINAVETAMKEEMLNKLLDLVDAVDYSRFSVVNSNGYDFEDSKYRRLQKQLQDYQTHFPELRVYCLLLKNGSPIVGLSSDSTPGINAIGQEFQFHTTLIKSLFETEQTAVVENVNSDGKKSFSAFVPLMDDFSGEVMMVVGMDFLADKYSKEVHKIGSSTVLTLLAFLILIIITFYFVYRRNSKSVEIRNKYRHIETIATFIFALLFTLIAVLLSNEYIRQSEKLAFQYDASVMANSIRAKFLDIRNNIEQLNSFFINSSDVSNSEFSSFTKSYLADGTVIAFSYYEVESQNKEAADLLYLPISSDDSVSIKLKYLNHSNYLHKSYIEKINKDEAVRKAAAIAIKTGMLTTSKSKKLTIDDRENNIVVLFLPVYQNQDSINILSSKTQIPIGLLSAMLLPQKNLEVALRKYQWAKQKLAISLFNIDKEGGEWVASYPYEHQHQLKSNYNVYEHMQLYTYATEMPLFAYGQTFSLVTHPEQGSNITNVYFRSWMIGVGGILISIILLLMVRQSRNKWSVLENEVNQRTTSLNRRIRDLDCQRMLSEKIQSATHADAWKEEVLILLRNVFLPNEGYSLSLECYDNKLESELFDVPKKKKIEAEIRVGSENIGRIGVFSSSNDLFVPEDQQLINQVALTLGNWIEHQRILAALKTSEEKFRNLIENAFDAIYLMEDRHYSYVNSGFVKLVDYSFEELTSKDFNFSALLTEKSKKIGEERFAARQQGLEVASTYETQLLTKSKLVKDVEISTVSVGEEGNVLIMGIIRDVTDRKN